MYLRDQSGDEKPASEFEGPFIKEGQHGLISKPSLMPIVSAFGIEGVWGMLD